MTKTPRPFPIQTALENLRIKKGHSYKFLADSIGMGSASNLSAALQGRSFPQVDTLTKIADFYGVQITLAPRERENLSRFDPKENQ